jgi:hypothetical protein
MRSALVIGWLCLVVGGCFDAPVGTPDPKTHETQRVSIGPAKDQVDILFVIDKSDSMLNKQTELKRRLPDLIRQLDVFAASGKKAHYHIGVVTTDMGAPGIPDCPNRGARLVGGGLDTARCPALGGGLGYLDYNQKNGENNLPPGRDLAQTFECMASVGTGGCGFEMQLEAGYQALHDDIPANQGFLRLDALLAVVWVTDEDDCSAPPDTDLFGGMAALQPAGYGALHSFRCAQYGMLCGSPLQSLPNAVASYAECVPAPAGQGKLYDVQRYINFFTRPKSQGGVKQDPATEVILLSIAGDADKGVRTLLANPRTTPYQPCTTWDKLSCVWLVDNACTSRVDPLWVGDPAIRLAKVVGAAAHQQQTSVCDVSYQAALEGLGQQIGEGLKPACLTSPLSRPEDPDCLVEDVTPRYDGEPDVVAPIPTCRSANNAAPCWRVIQATACAPVHNPTTGLDEQVGIEVERAGLAPPVGSTVRIQCATIAARK